MPTAGCGCARARAADAVPVDPFEHLLFGETCSRGLEVLEREPGDGVERARLASRAMRGLGEMLLVGQACEALKSTS